MYKNITQEYFIHFELSFLEFNRLMKIVITFIFVITIVIIANIQILFINHFLNPSLETCSFYDWYGNKIYNHQKVGTCPTLLNMETVKSKKISFGVLNDDQYIKHEYIYENYKLIKREITTYALTNDDIKIINSIDITLLQVLERDIIENTYSDTEFSSIHQQQVFNEDGSMQVNQENIINAILNDDDEIIVTKDSNELFRLNKVDNPKNKLILHDLYSVQKWPNDTLKETYYNRFTYHDEFKVKSIDYSIYIGSIKTPVTYYNTPIITNMVVDNTFHRFSINLNSVRTKMTSIDHYINNELMYKNIFTYTKYGYQVKHYAYYRNIWGKILAAKDRSTSSYCYCSNDLIHINDFDYENISDDRFNNYCSTPLFYTDNPLFLGN